MMKLLRWFFRLVLSLLLLIIVGLTAVTFLEISIDLTRFKQPIETLISAGLDRPIHIEKSITVSTSLQPSFFLEGLRIQNPDGFTTPDFLFMDLAKIQIELLPLFQLKVHIADFQVKDLHITLEETQKGEVNWIFNSDVDEVNGTTPEADVQSEPLPYQSNRQLGSDSVVIRNLLLENITVTRYKPDEKNPIKHKLERCLGSMVPGKPLRIEMAGKVDAHQYAAEISIASLDEFLTDNKSWMDIVASIAKTEIRLSGNVDLETATKSLALQMSIAGANLSDWNNLLNLELPPFADYRVAAELHLDDKTFDLRKLQIQTGLSSLNGSAKIVRDHEITDIMIELRSPLFQIDDFIFEDWSWSQEEPISLSQDDSDNKNEKPSPTIQPETSQERNLKLLDPEFLQQFSCSITIEAEKVLSGDDTLGSGQLKMALMDGRISIDPLIFALPKGLIRVSASVKPGIRASNATLTATMDNFDIGIFVRRSKPDSDMGGYVNLDIDLHSSASSFPELLANGNGHFDFSGNLKNFGSGIIDLWAVNLVAAIVSNTDKKQSQINCAVGRWTVKDGMLISDAFFIDTSKIRICATGQADFKQNRIDMQVEPKAKKAQFFSLATPLEIHGSFDDINIGLANGAIISTAIKFLASPMTVPLERAVYDKIPKNGRDVCNMQIGAANRVDIYVPVCNN